MVPGSVDADWHISLESEASLADIWVPFVELGDCEVGERFGNAETCVAALDFVESGAVGWTDCADAAGGDGAVLSAVAVVCASFEGSGVGYGQDGADC